MAKRKKLEKSQPPKEIVVHEESVPDETIIWRYFPFKRFLGILSKPELWFSRPFAFEDKWEGLFPPSYVRRTRQYAKASGIPFKEFDLEFRRRELRHRYAHFVNCWHIANDDIPAWSGTSVCRDGTVPYELKYGSHEQVSMMQAMLGQRGPTLEARSGICLIIAIYVPKHETGLLIHLWRDADLSNEASELIKKPFQKFNELSDAPTVWMLTSKRLSSVYPNQMQQAKKLLSTLAPNAQFREIVVADDGDEISVDVELDTLRGEIVVGDDFGFEDIIDCKI